MKLIKILFLVSVILSICGVASAGTYVNGTLDTYISGSDTEALVIGINLHAFTNTTTNTMDWIVDDVGQVGMPTKMVFENVNVPRQSGLDWVDDVPDVVGGPFYIGTNGEYGTGSFYIFKSSTVDMGDIYVYFDENYDAPEGNHIFKIYTSVLYNYYTGFLRSSTDAGRVQLHLDQFGCALVDAVTKPVGFKSGESGNCVFYNTGRFINDYSIYMDYSFGEFSAYRNVGGSLNSSSIEIKDSNGDQILSTGYSSTNNTYVYSNESAYYYIKPEINQVEYLIYSNIADVPDFESAGTIELNQTSYIDPEIVQINTSLTSYDFDDHIYRILMYYSDDDGTTWGRLTTSLNATSIISSTTESRTSDISSGFYNLPIKIKAVLEDYDKTTTTSSVVATSSEVYYNPTAAYDYTFSGTVFDAGTGSPIEGATIVATGATTTSDTSTVTGRFKLYLADGTYTINCSKSGYVSNVNEDIVVWTNISLYNIYLTQTSYTNGTMNGIIKDADTDESLQDVHLIFTNATDRIDAYTSVGGYYTASGFEQSTSYDIRAIKSGYYSYNGSVTIAASGGTHKSFDMVQINYSVTPTATALDTYPDGEGHAWTNDEIITMLRIVVPGIFMMMIIFLFLAVLMGVGGNNGGNGGQGMGMKELWQR